MPFLQAIQESPADDTLRLIFADWLEERGDVRCELIRLQCLPASEQADAAREKQRKKASRKWVKWHGTHFAGPIHRLARQWRYSRGFIEEIAIDATTFLDNAELLFRWAPLQRIHFFGAQVCPDRLAESRFLARLSSLDFQTGFNPEADGQFGLGPVSPISKSFYFGDEGAVRDWRPLPIWGD